MECIILTKLSALVTKRDLSVSAYLKQCVYLGISLSLALGAIGFTSKAEAAVEQSIISTSEANEIADLLSPDTHDQIEIQRVVQCECGGDMI
jgi:hypothetical protein